MEEENTSQASTENTKGVTKKQRPAVTSHHLTTALQALHATIASFTTSPSSTIQLPAFQAIVHSYLTSKSTHLSKHILTSVNTQIAQMAQRILSDVPPYVHLSKDAAPQLQIDVDQGKLVVKGGMRGYKMVRASHGVSSGGCWYYEAIVLNPPKVKDIINALPTNVRLGEGVREGLRRGLEAEEAKEKDMTDRPKLEEEQDQLSSSQVSKKRKIESICPNGVEQYGVGGHLRIGWSMRTGELQAPVGYDKWSYGIRDISGSKVHDSKREDKWGGVGFGPGDVIGIAINLSKQADSNTNDIDGNSGDGGGKKNAVMGSNHIRFFKNGNPMGHFVFSRGTKTGGEAFDDITPGTYYPAISLYMGATARANFGPHFVYPPRGLPTGMKVRPMSEVCQSPMKPEEVVDIFQKEKLFSKKVEDDIVKALMGALETEASMRYDAFKKQLADHAKIIHELRTERGLSTSDLPVVEEELDNADPEVDFSKKEVKEETNAIDVDINQEN